MRIGELNKIVSIQAPTKVSDGLGGFVTTWVTLATVPAAIWSVSANEIIAANAPIMVVSHRIRIRYRRGFKSAWRLKFGDKYFNIVSVINPNMGNEILDLIVKEAAG